ncbi:hypothetical protein ACWECC_15305 [Streptomyces microflavus]
MRYKIAECRRTLLDVIGFLGQWHLDRHQIRRIVCQRDRAVLRGRPWGGHRLWRGSGGRHLTRSASMCCLEAGAMTRAGGVRRCGTQDLKQGRQDHAALAVHTGVRRGLGNGHHAERGQSGQDSGTRSGGGGEQAGHGGGRAAAPRIDCSRAQPQAAAVRGVQGHENQGQTVGGCPAAGALGKEPGRGCGFGWI